MLGFGIVEYINILFIMVCVFLIFSVLLIPTILNFRTGQVYMNDPREGYAKNMIGNLGYSSVECVHIPVSLGRITLDCSYGEIGSIIDFGINNPSMGSPADACVNNNYNKKCKPYSDAQITKKLTNSIGKNSVFY